jgi:hypothetical protein
MRRPWLAVIVMLVALGGASRAQNVPAPSVAASAAQTGHAVIAGRVIDAATSRAVAGAVVTVDVAAPVGRPFGAGSPWPGRTSDSQGRFIFQDLVAGSFVIRANKNGYASGAAGKMRPDGQGQPIDVQNDGRVLDVVVKLWPQATLSGTVSDDTGEPIVGASVIPYRRTFVGGRPMYTGAANAFTDDRGQYRVDAAAGDYIVGVSFRLVAYPINFVEDSAAVQRSSREAQQTRSSELDRLGSLRQAVSPLFPTMRIGDLAIAQDSWPFVRQVDGHLFALANTFAPSSSTAEHAPVVTIAQGEQRSGLDIRVRTVPLVRVTGTAVGPDGPIANLGLRLEPASAADFRSADFVTQAQAVTDASGHFTFFGGTPGLYNVATPTSVLTTGALWASTPVTIGDQDVKDVLVTARAKVIVSGRIEFAGTRARPAPAQLRLTLDPADGRNSRPALNATADLSLRSSAIPPGQYFVRMLTAGPSSAGMQVAGWTLKSAMLKARDVVDEPLTVRDADITGLVVTWTDQPSMLTGTVRDAQGAIDSTAAVLVFPSDHAAWLDFGSAPRRFANLRVDQRGTFAIAGLPAGEYTAVALPDELSGSWQDPAVLEAVSRIATHVKVSDATSSSVDLKVVRR